MKLLLTSLYDPTDLGIRYLTSHLKGLGHEVESVNMKIQSKAEYIDLPNLNQIDKAVQCLNGSIITQNFLSRLPISQEELDVYGRLLSEYRPDIVGISTRSINFNILPSIIRTIRDTLPKVIILAGGAGPTLDPRIPLNYGVDIVIRGEGEYALEELLRILQQGGDWRKAHNLAWVEGEDLKTTPLLPLEKSLDNFSMKGFDPTHHRIIENDALYDYTASDTPRGISTHIAFYLATRGCPADCSYCSGRRIRNLYKNNGLPAPRIRKKSLRNIINDLENIKKERHIHFIDFCDEYFIYPTEDLLHFFIEYKDKINIPFHMNLSIDQIANNMQLLDAALEAGMAELWIGIQTGSERFCREVYNRINHNDNILKVVDHWKSNHMTLNVFMIAGNPLETEQDRDMTYDLLSKFPKFDPSFKSFTNYRTSKLTVFPDTDLAKLLPLQTPLCSHRDYYIEAMFIALRTILNDDEFEHAYRNNSYRDDPASLGQLYHSTIAIRHSDYLRTHLLNIKGSPVLYWGAGQVYNKLHQKISEYVHPSALVIDSLYRTNDMPTQSILTPERALKEFGNQIPIIAFGNRNHLGRIHRSIKKHGFTGPIISCAEVADI